MHKQGALREFGHYAAMNILGMIGISCYILADTFFVAQGTGSLGLAALNIANTMTMAIYERTKEIGVMKVLGCKLSKIRQMFLIESGTIGFIGGVIGCLFSVLISFVLNNFTVWMQAITGWLMSIGVQVNFDASSFDVGALFGMGGMGGIGNISDIPAWLLLMALIFATVVGLLSGIAPANRAVKISALEAIRHE